MISAIGRISFFWFKTSPGSQRTINIKRLAMRAEWLCQTRKIREKERLRLFELSV